MATVVAELPTMYFIENRTGTNDSMRSSDGGASYLSLIGPLPISRTTFFCTIGLLAETTGADYSLPSGPRRSSCGTSLFDNSSGDDASALFVGGQEHRYGEPQDPTPGEEQFFVRITDNLFVNNSNQREKSQFQCALPGKAAA